MKSTYKLLGVKWDHYPLPKNLPTFVENKEVEHYLIDRNLFDLERYERRVNLTEILSKDDNLPYDVAENVRECDCVYLKLDYEPTSPAREVKDFYSLRVLQIIAFFQNNLEKVPFVVMASNQAKEDLSKKYDEMKCAERKGRTL